LDIYNLPTYLQIEIEIVFFVPRYETHSDPRWVRVPEGEARGNSIETEGQKKSQARGTNKTFHPEDGEVSIMMSA